MYILVSAAAVLLLYSVYLLFASNRNFGVLLIFALTAFLWLCVIFYRPLLRFCGTTAGKMISILFAGCAGLFLLFMILIAAAGYSDRPRGDEKAMVVLGAALHGSHVSRVLQYRLDAAFDLWQQHPDMLIVTTGGQGPQEDLPEGQAMRDYLLEKGVPEDKVIAEDRSTSTLENLKFAAAILKSKGIAAGEPVTVVTNAFHCFRARLYAKKCGFGQVTTQPAGISAGSVLPCYMREVFAVGYMLLSSNRNEAAVAVVNAVDRAKRILWF